MPGPSLFIRENCPIATVDNDGLMSKEQVVQLNNASGGGITLPLNQDLTFTEGDKAVEIAASTTGNGGNLHLNAGDAGAEANNDGGDVVATPGQHGGSGPDGSFIVEGASGDVTIESQPDFGAPHIFGDDANGLYVTANGTGATRGGTGMSMVQDDVTPANSFLGLNINDENIAYVAPTGLMPESESPSTKTLGGDNSGGDKPWATAYARAVNCGVGANLALQAPAGQNIQLAPGGATYFFVKANEFSPNNNQSTLGTDIARWIAAYAYFFDLKLGAQLTAAATITPTSGLHHVVGATTIDTIAITNFGAGNPRLSLIADGGVITWSAAGNIAAAGTVAQNTMQIFQYDASAAKWYPQQ